MNDLLDGRATYNHVGKRITFKHDDIEEPAIITKRDIDISGEWLTVKCDSGKTFRVLVHTIKIGNDIIK